jgi:two-component system, LytTR family, sensor kinase
MSVWRRSVFLGQSRASVHEPGARLCQNTMLIVKSTSSTWQRGLFGYGLSIAFWMPLAALLTWQQFRITEEEHLRVSLGSIAILAAVRFFTVALLTPPIFWIAARAPISAGNVLRRMIFYLAGFVPFVLLFALIRWSLLPPWYPEIQQWGHRTLDALVALTYTTFGDELIVYLAIVIAAHAAVYFRKLQRQEVEQLALKEALTQSELQTLQMQIQPHFLFNTLNGISSLVRSDPTRAEQMILRLSSVLRRTLQQQDGSEIVQLADELRLAEDYLDIEAMRLGSRMSVRWNIQPETRSLMVPQFMFQLLIENGVKHGVGSSRGQGWIEIAASRTQRVLRLEVRNSVGGEVRQGMGVGHQNIRTRLSLLYGSDARLMFHRRDKIAVATLVLPVLSSAKFEAKTKTVRELEPEMRS